MGAEQQFDSFFQLTNLTSNLRAASLNQLEPQSHDPKATASDIFACFRLILGRAPNPEELTGHLASAGNELTAVVSNYLNSLEFESRGLFNKKSDSDIRLVYLEDFCIYTPTTDEAVGRHVAAGVYDPHIQSMLRRFLRIGMGVLDIGANIGVFSLLAATLVGPTGYVLAVEPNQDNVKLLEASRKENNFQHLVVFQGAATEKVEILALHSFGSNGTVNVIDRKSMLTAQTVSGLPIDRLINENQIVDFIKIDVEGGEYKALLGLSSVISKYKPIIVSEFSPGQLTMISNVSSVEYLRFLQNFGYGLGVVRSDGFPQMGLSIDEVQNAYLESGIDHIDIIAIT